ncbi:MAG TPA: hypothetical protein QKA14_00005, partial [Candidatus Megaira endosymbiont of Hartmannula sinica]|nr:hypothetical protein [Candidatus Megaera endosymbiont of Hartmannula sinica]
QKDFQRLNIIMDINSRIIDVKVFQEDILLLFITYNSRGFLLNTNSLISKTRTGKKIFNIKQSISSDMGININNEKINSNYLYKICYIKDEDTHISIIGSNRKMIVFAINELPLLKSGAGVIMQKYRDNQDIMSDCKSFNIKEGLKWKVGHSRIRTQSDLGLWISRRGGIGKNPPHGFPKNNKFDDIK